MNESLAMALVLVAGALLGAVFFGGLWWTVRKGISSKHPASLFLGSSLLRTSIALTGLYFVSGGRWERLLVCLAGFIVARLVVTWLTQSSGKSQPGPAQEVSHAP